MVHVWYMFEKYTSHIDPMGKYVCKVKGSEGLLLPPSLPWKLGPWVSLKDPTTPPYPTRKTPCVTPG